MVFRDKVATGKGYHAAAKAAAEARRLYTGGPAASPEVTRTGRVGPASARLRPKRLATRSGLKWPPKTTLRRRATTWWVHNSPTGVLQLSPWKNIPAGRHLANSVPPAGGNTHELHARCLPPREGPFLKSAKSFTAPRRPSASHRQRPACSITLSRSTRTEPPSTTCSLPSGQRIRSVSTVDASPSPNVTIFSEAER